MKALILTADGVEDSELFYPYYRLQEANFHVDVASQEAGPVTGKHGYVLQANKSFAEILTQEYLLLILPGGKGAEKVRIRERALEITREMHKDEKIIGAICHGPQVLISAGIIKGKVVTCYKTIKDDVIAAGADYVDRDVVVDGKLITSRHPGDLPAFAREIFNLL